MLYRAFLRDLAVTALLNYPTLAQRRVFSPRDWPTWGRDYPVILVQTPRERKESLMRGVPTFRTTASLSVIARVEEIDAPTAEERLEEFAEQIERALITDYDLVRNIQQFTFITTDVLVTAEGRSHLGELQMEFDLEFFQGVDNDYAAPPGTPLTDVYINADMQAPFDPNGTYPNPPFPAAVVPAPRTSGPDGRNEGALHIVLPQEEDPS